MTSSLQRSALCWDSLPEDVQTLLLDYALPHNLDLAGVSRSTYAHAARALYRRVSLRSLRQLSVFLRDDSGAAQHARVHTRTLHIHIPGVPGGGAIPSYSRERMLGNASAALLLCAPAVRDVAFSFYSTRVSQPFSESAAALGEGSSAGADSAAREGVLALASAIGACAQLESFAWQPPDSVHVVRGLSIAIVDQIVPAVVEGLRRAAVVATAQPRDAAGSEGEGKSAFTGARLRKLELHNIKFMDYDESAHDTTVTSSGRDGGGGVPRPVEMRGRSLDLASVLSDTSLFPSLSQVDISSATNLSHAAIALLLARSAAARVDISDGFAHSLWGPRVAAEGVARALGALFADGEEGPDERAARIDAAMRRLQLHVKQGPIEGTMHF